MDNNILDLIFDYQRFNENKRLQVMIDDVINEYSSDKNKESKIAPFEPERKDPTGKRGNGA